MKRFYLTSLLLLIIISCSKDDSKNDIIEDEEEEVVNLAPNDFSVDINDVSDDSAIISWEQATDPENDSVTYSIYLNQTLIVEGISELTFQLTDLSELTEYTGKVIAIDSNNNQTWVTFTFQTNKYYLKYLKKYDFGLYDYGPNGYAYGGPYSMIKTSDENYLIAGFSNFPDGAGYRFFVLKIDYEGNEIWKKFYDYSLGESLNPKITESSNSYIMVANFHVLSLDFNGNLIWYRKIDSYDINIEPHEIRAVKADSNNNIYLVGGRTSTLYPNIVQEAVLTKLDYNGNVIFENVYTPTSHNYFDDLLIISSGELVVLGSINNSGSASVEQMDFWVLKIDSEGSILWQNSYGDGRYDFPKNIILKSNGNYLFNGSSVGAYDIDTSRIFEIDPDGSEILNIPVADFISKSIAETLDGGYITTGKFVPSGESFGDLGLFKFDINGNLEWNHIFSGGFNIHWDGASVLQEQDGGYRIAGSSGKVYYSVDEIPELLILKTDPEGNYE